MVEQKRGMGGVVALVVVTSLMCTTMGQSRGGRVGGRGGEWEPRLGGGHQGAGVGEPVGWKMVFLSRGVGRGLGSRRRFLSQEDAPCIPTRSCDVLCPKLMSTKGLARGCDDEALPLRPHLVLSIKLSLKYHFSIPIHQVLCSTLPPGFVDPPSGEDEREFFATYSDLYILNLLSRALGRSTSNARPVCITQTTPPDYYDAPSNQYYDQPQPDQRAQGYGGMGGDGGQAGIVMAAAVRQFLLSRHPRNSIHLLNHDTPPTQHNDGRDDKVGGQGRGGRPIQFQDQEFQPDGPTQRGAQMGQGGEESEAMSEEYNQAPEYYTVEPSWTILLDGAIKSGELVGDLNRLWSEDVRDAIGQGSVKGGFVWATSDEGQMFLSNCHSLSQARLPPNCPSQDPEPTTALPVKVNVTKIAGVRCYDGRHPLEIGKDVTLLGRLVVQMVEEKAVGSVICITPPTHTADTFTAHIHTNLTRHDLAQTLEKLEGNGVQMSAVLTGNATANTDDKSSLASFTSSSLLLLISPFPILLLRVSS